MRLIREQIKSIFRDKGFRPVSIAADQAAGSRGVNERISRRVKGNTAAPAAQFSAQFLPRSLDDGARDPQSEAGAVLNLAGPLRQNSINLEQSISERSMHHGDCEP
jgi:hypothetical protein